MLYTINEVAEKLRLKPHTIYRWVWSGRIKALKLGDKTIRIPEEEVQKIMVDRNEFDRRAKEKGK